MTNLTMYIQEQIKDLKKPHSAATRKNKRSAIIKSYNQAGIMTESGKIRKEFK